MQSLVNSRTRSPMPAFTFGLMYAMLLRAHVKAMEIAEAASKRFFVTTGYFSNKEICDIIRKNFLQYKDLPSKSTPSGDFPEGGMFKVNNKRSAEVLGLKSRSLEECVVDTIKSLQSVGL